jgi:ABC-type multidrug transport system fused ATPase/permease subunit
MEKEIESAAEMLNLSNAAFHVATSRQDGDLADGKGCSEKTERPFQVAKFDLSLVKGEVLAVCGPVAAGKVKAERVLPPVTQYCCLTFSGYVCILFQSTLINGIIGEAPGSSQDAVSMNGKVAYVPQTPFILNSTLRENIIFGLPFNRKLYDKVIHACCLNRDIDQLGDAKDLTEIGERGVTLSGGKFLFQTQTCTLTL